MSFNDQCNLSLLHSSSVCLHPNHRCPATAPPSLWMAANQRWVTPVQRSSFYWARSVALCVWRFGRPQCPCECPCQTPFSMPSMAGTTSQRKGRRQPHCVFTVVYLDSLCSRVQTGGNENPCSINLNE